MLTICRLCCAKDGTIDLFSNTEVLAPHVKIKYCCDNKLSIERNDNLPSRICLQCDDELNKCYNFLQKCEAADQKFRTSGHLYSQSPSAEHESVIPDNFNLIRKNETDYSILKINEEKQIHNTFMHGATEVPSKNLPSVQEHRSTNEIKINGNDVHKGLVKCLTCGKGFLCNSSLLKHSEICRLKCSMCKKRFKSESLLQIHQTIHTIENSNSVSEAASETTSSHSSEEKRNYHRSTECQICHRICINNSVLLAHLRSHTNDRPFQCSTCIKSFKNSTALKRHKQSHFGAKNFICDNCGKSFVSKTSLNTHIRTHTGETPYACTFCSARFNQTSSLIVHTRRQHTGLKPFCCTQCNKTFVTKHELQSHLVVHSAERTYNCGICNKWFKFKSVLKKHTEIHGNKTKFICDYCGFICNFKINLATHIARRHSVKSGFCSICSKNTSNIAEHMGKHNGHRPFNCQYCPGRFLDKRGLQYHIGFKHTKSNKYRCDKDGCEAGFPSRPMLNYHTAKLHSNVAPYPCDLCCRRFYRKSDFARHKLGTHKQKLDHV